MMKFEDCPGRLVGTNGNIGSQNFEVADNRVYFEFSISNHKMLAFELNTELLLPTGANWMDRIGN